MKPLYYLAFPLSIVFAACSTDEEEGSGSGRGEASLGGRDGSSAEDGEALVDPHEACVLQADGTCPDLPDDCCSRAEGQRYDPARGCLEPEPFVLGCMLSYPREPDGACLTEDWFECKSRTIADGGVELVLAHEFSTISPGSLWDANGFRACDYGTAAEVLRGAVCQ
jgi:hypothetical protein